MNFHTRKAAWTAMILSQVLHDARIFNIRPQPDGSVIFFKLGVWSRYTPEAVEPLPIQSQGQNLVQDQAREPRMVTSPLVFEQRGDKWNARNAQHSADRPLPRHPRRDAFGELCQKPTIEGFDEGWGVNRDAVRSKARNLMRVRREKPMDAPAGASRRLFVAQKAYREGKLG